MSEPELEEFDARRRRLCPDGDCVGVVGPDGHCRVCGRFDPDASSDGRPGLSPAAFAGGCASEDEFETESSGHHTGEHEEAGPEAANDFDSGRPLCPDGACVGVLDANGRCKECGKECAKECGTTAATGGLDPGGGS